MIYLDNAATTLQKPSSVAKAMEQALLCCANPGRGGHRPAMKAAELVYDCRQAAADLFGLDTPERVVFTLNATHSLNLAIKSLLHKGGHAVISGYEHNSVVRPLVSMAEHGVSYTVAEAPLFSPEALCPAVEAAIRPETRCIIVTHVSNVFGSVLPLEQLSELCMARGLPMVVDASQSAGILPLRCKSLPAAAFVCMPGHKALYGPQGTGLLLCCKDTELYSLIQGGTGSLSLETSQPDFLPDALESGTLNVPGIAGLREGIRFVAKRREEIFLREKALLRRTVELLSDLPLELFYQEDCQSGVLSFRVKGREPEDICQALAGRGICVRGGLHCAPLAHRTAGTLPEGTVRLSFSAFNTREETEQLARILKESLKTC